MEAPDGTSLSDVTSTAIVGNALPSGAVVLTGALAYSLSDVVPGGTADVTLQLPIGSAPSAVFKAVNGVYEDVTSIATITGDTIVVHLTDGGVGDEDGQANGVVVDPIVPIRARPPIAPSIDGVSLTASAASVAFTAAQDGGSAVLSATVSCSSSNGGTSRSATGGTSPITVGGLTPNKTYTCTVTARNAIGQSAPSLQSAPFVALAPPPVITRLAPTSGSGAGGTKVTITGKEFTGVVAVTFGGQPAASFTVSVDGKSISAVTPAHAPGLLDVVVTTAGGSNLPSLDSEYTFLVPPAFSVNDVVVVEGNGSKIVQAVIRLSPGAGSATSVKLAAVSIGSATAGTDFVAKAPTTVRFAKGELQKTVAITIKGDSAIEPDESFGLELTGPDRADIADGTATVTIIDDDTVPNLTVEPVTAMEGNSGSHLVSFTLVLDRPYGKTVSVKYETVNATATSGSDFVRMAPTALAFSPGQTRKSVTVTIKGDRVIEPDESFYVRLSAPVNAVVPTSQILATIVNDD